MPILTKILAFTQRLQPVTFFMALFLVYVGLTMIIFQHRLLHLSTHTTMPDVDTDTGLWYQWYLWHMSDQNLIYDVTDLSNYPYGYDISVAPIRTLIYDSHILILRMVGYSWQKLILINNLSALSVYSTSAIGAALLSYYLYRHRVAAAISGLVYGFSFYLIYMGRGMMSINHVELVPFFLLSCFAFWRHPNIFRLFISAILYGLLFRIDAYYAFWSMLIVGILMFFLQPWWRWQTLLKIISYTSMLIIVCLMMNMEMFVGQYQIMSTTSLLKQSGRDSSPRNELLSLSYYFLLPLPHLNLLVEMIGPVAEVIFPLVVLAGPIGLYIWSYQRYSQIQSKHAISSRSGILNFELASELTTLMLIVYLILCLLSSYIPMLFWINQIYFQFFGMFRSVARLAIFVNLFLGLFIAGVIKLSEFYQIKSRYRNFAVMVFVIVFIIGDINTDVTWKRLTDWRKIAALYEPIRTDDRIKSIFFLPYRLSAGTRGFPPTYSVLGQVIHGKPHVNGYSVFASEIDGQYQQLVQSPDMKLSLDTLQSQGISTLLVYDKLGFADELAMQATLSADPRLTLTHSLSEGHDPGYISANDMARKISVYDIAPLATASSSITDSPLSVQGATMTQLVKKRVGWYTFQLVAPTDVQLEPIELKAKFPYSKKWKLYVGDYSRWHFPWFIKSQPELPHQPQRWGDPYNYWQIPAENLSQNQSFSLIFVPEFLRFLSDAVFIIIIFIAGGVIVVKIAWHIIDPHPRIKK